MNTLYDLTSACMHITLDIPVPMRDGIHLATDVYLPADTEGPWPVVIERTPYDKSAASRSEVRLDGHHLTREEMAAAFTQAGFAVVFQDCRGRYGSEGIFTKYINEGEDGFDTLAWITGQQWCNGRIGSMGLSYAAHTQLAMACLNPPGLTTMVLDSGGFHNAYHCGVRQGGAFELKQATWAFRRAKESPAAKADPALRQALENEDIHEWFKRMPWRVGHSPLRHLPEYEAYLLDQWSRGRFDDYWQQLGICAEAWFDTIPDIPVMFMSSWYDAYVSSTLANYQAFRQGRQAPQRLIMGPWLHGDRNVTHSGDAEFGPLAAFDGQLATDWLSCRLDWFNQHLKTHEALDHGAPDVQVFLMGTGTGQRNDDGRMEHGGRWLSAAQWPLPDSHEQAFYLHPEGSLGAHPPAVAEASLNYRSDPDHPVPTLGGALTSGAPIFAGGAFDQRETPEFFGALGDGRSISARDDVLTFQTEPLEHDLIVAGPVRVELWVQTDGLDTDFTAKLVDVYPVSDDYPEGYAMNITDGILRCRYRASWDNPTPVTPGERFAITIEPFATCNLFKRGHRLRVDIASSNFPHFDVNPNSGEPEGQAFNKRVATNTLHMGMCNPSRIVLRILDQSV
ncbi:CocE/NonD family hydrolase [Pseudomonas sp. SDO5271_S396]